MFFKECVKIMNIDFNNKKSLNYFEADELVSDCFVLNFIISSFTMPSFRLPDV